MMSNIHIDGTIIIYPAFHTQQTWKFSVDNDCLLVDYLFSNLSHSIVIQSSLVLDFFKEAEFKVLCGYNDKGGIDGVTVYYELWQSIAKYHAEVWCPRKIHGSYFGLLELLWNAGRQGDAELQANLYDIKNYFEEMQTSLFDT